jgi:hypothetical protein
MKNLLDEDIKSSQSNILKLVYKPKEYIKKKIHSDFSNMTKDIFKEGNFIDLEMNLTNCINQIPKNIKKIEEEVIRIENIYKEEEDNKIIEKKIEDLEKKVIKYNSLCENLFKMSDNIALDIQIEPNYVKDCLKGKNDLILYEKFLNEEKTIIYWEIPFKNEKEKSIRYKNDYQIYSGKEIYFINEGCKKLLYFKKNRIKFNFRIKNNENLVFLKINFNIFNNIMNKLFF